jgi:hypothetical protein
VKRISWWKVIVKSLPLEAFWEYVVFLLRVSKRWLAGGLRDALGSWDKYPGRRFFNATWLKTPTLSFVGKGYICVHS